jgi:hypothetical protein
MCIGCIPIHVLHTQRLVTFQISCQRRGCHESSYPVARKHVLKMSRKLRAPMLSSVVQGSKVPRTTRG